MLFWQSSILLQNTRMILQCWYMLKTFFEVPSEHIIQFLLCLIYIFNATAISLLIKSWQIKAAGKNLLYDTQKFVWASSELFPINCSDFVHFWFLQFSPVWNAVIALGFHLTSMILKDNQDASENILGFMSLHLPDLIVFLCIQHFAVFSFFRPWQF